MAVVSLACHVDGEPEWLGRRHRHRMSAFAELGVTEHELVLSDGHRKVSDGRVTDTLPIEPDFGRLEDSELDLLLAEVVGRPSNDRGIGLDYPYSRVDVTPDASGVLDEALLYALTLGGK